MVMGLGSTINADIQGQIEFYLFKLPNAVDILFDGWCIDQCKKFFRADTIKHRRPQMTGDHISKCTKRISIDQQCLVKALDHKCSSKLVLGLKTLAKCGGSPV